MAAGDGWRAMLAQKTVTKPLEMLGRTEWAALPPRYTKPLDLPVDKIFLISTNRPSCYKQRQCVEEMQKIQNFQMLVPTIPDIRYNFVISGAGTVYEGRGWLYCPDLPKTYSKLEKKALFIGFSGDFSNPKAIVPSQMLEAMELLFKLGMDYKYISPDFETFDLC